MALLKRLRANLRHLRQGLARMRLRGWSLAAVLLWQLPAALALRGWRLLAQALNARLLLGWINARRLSVFEASLPPVAGLRWVIIVMPHTLHFLLPCLHLLCSQQPRPALLLVANGAKEWERALLRSRLPGVPMFSLCTVPGSSVSHGDVLSLLLEHHRGDFGIVDHDAYVFDAGLLSRLQPGADECMAAVFSQVSLRTGLRYPLTHLLGFNAAALRASMHRWQVDARQYRHAPTRLADLLSRVGMGPRRYLKDYQRYHDTLHVLLGVTLAEGLHVRFEPSDADPVVHLGGTSIGSHHTKSLFALYLHLRFLALLDDPVICRRYAFLTSPLRHADEALARCRPGEPEWASLPAVESLIQRLAAAGAVHA